MTSAQTPAHPAVGTLGSTSIDCPDPAELADFYAALLGMRRLVETPVDAAVAAAERLGARQADSQPQPALWRVMLDPAGHPFCLTTVTAA